MLRHFSKRLLGRECAILEQRSSDAGIARFLSTGISEDLKTVLSEKVPAEQVCCSMLTYDNMPGDCDRSFPPRVENHRMLFYSLWYLIRQFAFAGTCEILQERNG